MQQKPRVVMMGLGYIGLPTAALIASKGLQVTGVDVSEQVVEIINKGSIHIVEPDLEGLVHHVVKNGKLKATTQPIMADVYLIAVPTPFKNDKQPDLKYVQQSIEAITPTLQKGALIIIESTSPIGTTEQMQKLVYTLRPELKDTLYFAYCPERVLPGNIIHELKTNDRAIGGINSESAEKAMDFYRSFVAGTLYKTDAKTAEMVKIVENASRDNQIAFANELSIICDKVGVDVWEMIKLANKHPRVNILQPGTGVGGHCIAVDPWFIISNFPEESKLMLTSRERNIYKTEWVIEKIKNEALTFEIKNNRKPIIAAMGLAFKPNIDDLRESPALYVVNQLQSSGLQILEVEPNLTNGKRSSIVNYKKAIQDADIIVFLVAHKVFKNLEVSKNKTVMNFCGIKLKGIN